MEVWHGLGVVMSDSDVCNREREIEREAWPAHYREPSIEPQTIVVPCRRDVFVLYWKVTYEAQEEHALTIKWMHVYADEACTVPVGEDITLDFWPRDVQADILLAVQSAIFEQQELKRWERHQREWDEMMRRIGR